MTEMTPGTHERLWHEWYALWHDADASQPKASYEEWLEFRIEALEEELALSEAARKLAIKLGERIDKDIEALWSRCRIVYYPPATGARGWVQPYPIEHNMAAGKNGRDAIEAALAAEEPAHGGSPMTLREVMEQEEKP